MKTLIHKFNYLAILAVIGLMILLVLDGSGFMDNDQPKLVVMILGVVLPIIVVPYTFYLFYDCFINPDVENKTLWIVMFLFFAPITAVFYSKSKGYLEQSTMLEQIKEL